MNLKVENGITIIALIITIILMLILAGVGMHFGSGALDKAKLEDIKTEMLSIKPKAKIVADKYNFKDIENLVGTPLDQNADQEGIQTSAYKISDELNAIFNEKNEEGKAKIDVSKLYVWTKEDLNSQGLNTIDVDENKFYIVYYNLKDANACEVYYSQGIQGQYSLNALQDM